MAYISCRDVTLAYDRRPVVTGLTFSVNPGDYLCIVGENGSGKSTLVKALVGLKTPAQGEIEFGDGLRPTEIGYLPQQTEIQRSFPASVFEIVRSGCMSRLGKRPFFGANERRHAESALSRFRLDALKRRPYGELSGGQQQRVLLARAFCATEKLLVLDEPGASLDPLVTKELYEIIQTVNAEERITIVMISHDIHNAVVGASHILHLNNRPLFFGPTAEYVETPLGRFYREGTQL